MIVFELLSSLFCFSFLTDLFVMEINISFSTNLFNMALPTSSSLSFLSNFSYFVNLPISRWVVGSVASCLCSASYVFPVWLSPPSWGPYNSLLLSFSFPTEHPQSFIYDNWSWNYIMFFSYTSSSLFALWASAWICASLVWFSPCCKPSTC